MDPKNIKPLITQADARISEHVRQTPTITLPTGAFGVKAYLTLKLELMQHAGSFKSRSAFNRILSNSVPPAGVIAASGGNHGAAVAYAARQLGHPAEIFVPTLSSPIKVDRLRSYGANVVITGRDYIEALEKSEIRAAETGSLVVHAFDQAEVIAGQGTVGLEFENQAPDLDTVLVSVGGGGLIAGIAAWYQGRCKLVSVEPVRAPTLYQSLTAGKRTEVEVGGIAADALGSRRVGKMMFPIAQQYISKAVLVEEEAIIQAQKLLWDELRIAAEPAGAVPIAALISGRYQPAPEEKVGVLICGGNVDLSSL
ncbi:MAG: threonine/serine dehydratase [Cyanobacteria bacterium J06607_13]